MSRARFQQPAWWSLPVDAVERELKTMPRGLSRLEAQTRLASFGHNALRRKRPRAFWSILAAQFRSLLVLLLAAAGASSFLFDKRVEAFAILAVIGLNALIGFAMELRATRSMEALHRLGHAMATVRRDGALCRISALALVPGDILVVEAGDVITTDARLRQANKLEADESTLTGESYPVSKGTEPLPQATAVADRTNMLFKGTVVTRGSGEGVVVATGMQTELGKISRLLEDAQDEETPLERRLSLLARRLLWVTLAVAALVAAAGLASYREPWLIVETAIALAVATVPEGLPIVATLALARGMWKMARRNSLVRRLSAVETLGATGVILTDKTGTLTENRQRVEKVLTDDGEYAFFTGRGAKQCFDGEEAAPAARDDTLLRRALLIGVLCNNASLTTSDRTPARSGVGDPLELALLAAGSAAGIRAEELARALPELREEAFDPESRMMATFHRHGREILVAAKGAPEAILAACSSVATLSGVRQLTPSDRAHWLEKAQGMARLGRRVLALAEKEAHADSEPAYTELTLVGLVAMRDPPREDVTDVVEACRRAGVRLIMATGDQAATAGAIAESVGMAAPGARVLRGCDLAKQSDSLEGDALNALLGVNVFARTSPREKLDLIRLHQRAGSIVAMIGDGVNDAPALRQADIGVAMGRRATEVAKEAADMVLLDDSLGTIVLAIEQGRIIFDNIRKFVVYLLSCNVSELLAVGIASLFGSLLPVLPLQILFLNLVTDVFPALALAACHAEADVMQRPPRSLRESVITKRHWWAIAGFGLLITLAVLVSLYVARGVFRLPVSEAVTVSFLTLGFAQTFHVFNMRAPRSGVFCNEVTRNGWIWAAIFICALLLILAAHAPVLTRVLDARSPSPTGWAIVVTMSVLPVVVGQSVLALGAAQRATGTRARLLTESN